MGTAHRAIPGVFREGSGFLKTYAYRFNDQISSETVEYAINIVGNASKLWTLHFKSSWFHFI